MPDASAFTFYHLNKPKTRSMSISSEMSGNKHSDSKKPPLRQYLKCALQNRNCGMKILYLVLGTAVIVSFLQKSKTIIFKSALSLPPLQILHHETSRDLPCKPLPPSNASGYSHKTIPRTTIQAPASQRNHHHPPSI